jgi:hypothetical protein
MRTVIAIGAATFLLAGCCFPTGLRRDPEPNCGPYSGGSQCATAGEAPGGGQ